MAEGAMLGITNILVGLLIMVLCIPLMQDKIEMNRWYGFRFKKSYASVENWYEINRYGAKRMFFWSILIIVIGILTFFIPTEVRSSIPVALACAPLTVIIPAIESWLFARKL